MSLSVDLGASILQTQSVARMLRINLTTARAEGRLSQSALDGMVERCLACAFPEDCTKWLSECSGGEGAAPGFCPNRKELARLSPR